MIIRVFNDLHIIDGSASILSDADEASILRSVKKCRGPIIRHVLRNRAGRAGRFTSLLEIHRKSKPISTHDCMKVSRYLPRVDDRIGTFNNNGRLAW
jgi:hypothetical protein